MIPSFKYLIMGDIMADLKRIKLEVYVNLDPTPGTFHTGDSALAVITSLLDSAMPHYKPEVRLVRNVPKTDKNSPEWRAYMQEIMDDSMN